MALLSSVNVWGRWLRPSKEAGEIPSSIRGSAEPGEEANSSL